jgi:endonuclease YncB( thermonuclease family)
VLQSEDQLSFAAQDVYVIDGDTLGIGEERYRLLGFDTPETKRARCKRERLLGEKATMRLRALIDNARAVKLDVLTQRDRYNRYLARAYVSDQNVADLLISEGLARSYNGGKRMPWCTPDERAANTKLLENWVVIFNCPNTDRSTQMLCQGWRPQQSQNGLTGKVRSATEANREFAAVAPFKRSSAPNVNRSRLSLQSAAEES